MSLTLQIYKGRGNGCLPLSFWQNVLQHAAAHCNALQHTAARCNTLQHYYGVTMEEEVEFFQK